MSTAIGIISVILFTAAVAVIGIAAFRELFRADDAFSPSTSPLPLPTAAWLTAIRITLIAIVLVLTNKSFTVFSSWDGHHYMFLAEHGYVPSGEGVEFIVFYPFYPLCMAILNFITGSSFVSGILISNVCFMVSLILLYKLCSFDMPHKDSLFTVCAFALSPFSFFFSGVYTEGIFIMLTLLFFIFLREKKYIPLAVCGYLAAITRVHGVLLFIPAVYELFKSDRKKLLYSLSAPCGFITYLIINKVVLGDFFAFSEYQESIWSQHFSFFGKNIKTYADYIIGGSELTVPIMLPQLVLFFISIILIFSALKNKHKISYLLYSIAYIFVTYSASWLLSGGRYLSALFPLFIFLPTAIKNRYARIAVLIAEIILMAIYTVHYVLGNQVM